MSDFSDFYLAVDILFARDLDKYERLFGSKELKNGIGETLLHFFAVENQTDIVEFLIRNNANLAVENSCGHTALMDAAGLNHTEIISTLVRSGADVNHRSSKDGATALHRAALHRKEAAYQLLIGLGAIDTIRDFIGFTPLDLWELGIRFGDEDTGQIS